MLNDEAHHCYREKAVAAKCAATVPLDLVDFMDSADVGMIERRDRLGLAQKALLGLRVLDGVGAEELQSDLAFELGVLGLVDDAHAAFADLLGDAEMADGPADHDGSILPFRGYLLITIDVTNYQIFFVQGAASARFPGPSEAVSSLGRRIVHANRIYQHLSPEEHYLVRFMGLMPTGCLDITAARLLG